MSQGSGKEERVRSRYREQYERNKRLLVVDSRSCRILHAKSLSPMRAPDSAVYWFLDAVSEVKDAGRISFLDRCVTTAELNKLMRV